MIKKRVRNHTNPFSIRQRLNSYTIQPSYMTYSHIDLEIGFGRGQFLTSYAQKNPDRLIVGVDVRQLMVKYFKASLPVNNIIPIWGTGQICLEDVIPNQTLSRVFIFHPDPWFKKRHHPRRILNNSLINLLKDKMKPHGRLYISTDVEPLYQDMRAICLTNPVTEIIKNDTFWTTNYNTHWSSFSEQDKRKQFFLTVQFKEFL